MVARLAHPRVLLALGLFLIGVVLAFHAWGGPSDAMLVPRIVLTLWCVIALAITLAELSRGSGLGSGSLSTLPVLMAAVLIAAIAVASLGFLIPSLPLVALTLWMFRLRRPLPLAVGTLVIAGGLWFLFHHVLLIRLPTLLNSGAL
ncbi:tripartite tricarboxylate transporter TctB family protein [Halomonas titanicae]|uniref:tripartite tricarboxylate transporter TctB family protein n=1 Tax=Vreelandella titanicae TaxID=664683 RepID=UPI001F42191A|nr:tripartite tricarboxylate transporter TctB family protein [Halomonas titanicae]MCE7520189.1 tripartite tricarboxylate transporter TctB family protein [Halomonas titanicae]